MLFRSKKKGKTLSLGKFHIEVESAYPQGQSAVAQTRARTADPTPQTRRPNYKSKEEFPLLGASPAASSHKQNFHAAAHPPESDRLLPREQVMDVSGSPSELACLKAAAAELARLKARDDLLEELAAEGSAELKAETNMLLKEFAHLLQTYKMKGCISFYGRRALQMVPSNDFDFVVDFNHVLDEGYIDLAVKIVKENDACRGNAWLLGTAINFLRTPRLLDRNELQSVFLDFENLPVSMKSFAQYDALDLVQGDASPFGQENHLVTARFIGRQIYISAEEHVLKQNLAGKTWGGQFEAKDIYIILFSRTSILCLIRPSGETLVCSPENRVLDIKKLHEIMSVKYELAGHFPPHFKCLDDDISLLDATTIDVSSVVQYLPYHVALMPFAANEYLTEKLHKAIESVRIPANEFRDYISVFESVPAGNVDWRDDYTESNSQDELLKAVYKHDPRAIQQILDKSIGPVQEDTSNTEVQITSATVLQENTRFAELQESTRQDSSSSTGVRSSAVTEKTKFKRNKKGKLAFKRHLDVHLHSHLAAKAGTRPLSGMFQAEAYSSKNNDVLGEIFTDLFSGPSMKMKKFLRPIMAHYRHLRDMDDE